MSQRDDHLGPDDEDVVRRLREEKPQLSAFELDRVKTTVMARVKPSSAKRSAPKRSAVRSRVLVAALTLGLMGAGTAGAVAGSSGGSSVAGISTGAADSQYHYCHYHKYSPICLCIHHPVICVCLLFGLVHGCCPDNEAALATGNGAFGDHHHHDWCDPEATRQTSAAAAPPTATVVGAASGKGGGSSGSKGAGSSGVLVSKTRRTH